MAKKTIVNEVASALGAAAARVENLTPKRAMGAKHSKARQIAVPEETSAEETIAEVTPEVGVDYAEVARIAYLKWEARGGQNGSPEDDWTAAERELRAGA